MNVLHQVFNDVPVIWRQEGVFFVGRVGGGNLFVNVFLHDSVQLGKQDSRRQTALRVVDVMLRQRSSHFVHSLLQTCLLAKFLQVCQTGSTRAI